MGRKLHLVALFAALALAPLSNSQTPTIVSPRNAAAGPGNSNNSYPFSLGPSTYQQVHSAGSFTIAGPHMIQVLRVKPKLGQAANTSVDLEVRMADSPNNSAGASSNFAANVVPGTEVTVCQRRVVNLPVPTTLGWTLSFPFDQPFSWAGSHLSWFVQVFGNSSGGQLLDRGFDAFSDAGPIRSSTFNGCASALGTAPPHLFSRVGGPGGDCSFVAYSYVSSGALPAAMLFGLAPIQIDLTPIGAPGCALTTDVLGVVYGLTAPGPNGQVEIHVPIPADPTLPGASFRTQCAFVQQGANALDIFFTNGTSNTIGQDPRVARIFGGAGAASGTVEHHYGLAIALD